MMNILIPMAGLGSRFYKAGNKIPKPLIKVLDKTLIEHSIDSFNVDGRFIFITRDFENSQDNEILTKILKDKRPESIEIKLSKATSGATETALAAKDIINTDDPLVIYNCDQKINWNSHDFLNFINEHNPDAALVLYSSKDPKNSFAKVDNGKIIKVVEKQVISDHALIGFHYWANGKDFVSSAKKLIENFRQNGKPECYVSETFNFLQNKNILPYHIADNIYIPLGTPEDIAKYQGKIKEYSTNKPKTLLIDIDGTVLEHVHAISEVYNRAPKILPDVVEKINKWDSNGHKIIFITARKESTRAITETQLRQFGLAWDQLIMGVGNGERFLINDKLSKKDPDRAIAVNVITNAGFGDISWEDYDL